MLEGSLFIWLNTCFPVVIPPERIPRNGKYDVTCFTIDSMSDFSSNPFAAFNCVEPSKQVHELADS